MSNSAEKQEELDLNFHTDMPVGEILRRTRNHYGQNLQQVESILRIRASQLEALENGDVAQLPGRVYAIGFVRSYSEYLGLDGDKMVHLFKEQSVGKRKKPDLHFPAPVSESKMPSIIVIGSCVFGVFVLVGFIAFMLFPAPRKNEIPPVPEVLNEAQLNQAPSLVEPATDPAVAAAVTQPEPTTPTEPAQPAAPVSRITLEITDSSWVEIRNADGAAILRQVLKPGDVYIVPPDPGLVMATGNAGGINIKLDGKSLGPLGDIGQIKRKVPLDPASLGGSAAATPTALPTTVPPVPASATAPAAAASTPPKPAPIEQPVEQQPVVTKQPATQPRRVSKRVPDDTKYPSNMFQTPN